MNPSRRLILLTSAAAMMLAAKVSAAPSDGRIVFTDSTETPQSWSYTGATNQFAQDPSAWMGDRSGQTWLVQRTSPRGTSRLLGYVVDQQLHVMEWNGTGWSLAWFAPLGTSNALGRPFDIAYETASGRAVVVYRDGDTGKVGYRVWEPTGWGVGASFQPQRLTENGTPNYFKLAPEPRTNRVALAVSDDNNALSVLIWDGATWGSEPVDSITTKLYRFQAPGDNDAFDLAWSLQAGSASELLLVYAEKSGGGAGAKLFHRRFTGGAWNLGTEWGNWNGPLHVFAAGDPSSSQVLMGAIRQSKAHAMVWTGTSMKQQKELGNGTATARQRSIHGGWARIGNLSVPFVVWEDSAPGGNISVAYSLDGGSNYTTMPLNCVGSPDPMAWTEVSVDSLNPAQGLLVFSDAAGVLWSRRFAAHAGGVTCTEVSGGSPLATGIGVQSQNFAFDWERTTVLIGEGNDPGDSSICPGSATGVGQSAAVDLDGFTLATSSGSLSIDELTVTLAAGTAAALSRVEVVDSNGASLGSIEGSLSTDEVRIPLLSPLVLDMVAMNLLVRVTPKSQADMPSTPKVYAVTGKVTSVSPNSGLDLGDTSSATLTIDNDPPAAPSLTGTAENGAATLSWDVNPDAPWMLILRSTNPGAIDVPTDGSDYAVGNPVGTSAVAFSGNQGPPASDTGLTNGTTYYYRGFVKDACDNWSAASTEVQIMPRLPALTVVGTGTDPTGPNRICPVGQDTSSSPAWLESFSLETSWTGDQDAVSMVRVELSDTDWEALATVRVDANTGSGSFGERQPQGKVVEVGTTDLKATSTATDYRITVVPRRFSDLQSKEYQVTGKVIGIASDTKQTDVRDTAGPVLTIDALAPGEVTGLRAQAGDGSVTLSWTNPTTSDFEEVMVVRKGLLFDGSPEAGSAYSEGSLLGSNPVVYVGQGSSYTDASVTNGLPYTYRVFTRDRCFNYSAKVEAAPVRPGKSETQIRHGAPPANKSVCPGTPAVEVARFNASVTRDPDVITQLTVKLSSGASSVIGEVVITDQSGGRIAGKEVLGNEVPGNEVTFDSLSLQVTKDAKEYAIWLTPKTHAALGNAPGQVTQVTAHVSAISCERTPSVDGGKSATLTVDNAAPARPVMAAPVVGGGRVDLSWTKPQDSAGVVVVRATEPPTGAPEDGRTYLPGDLLAGGKVVSVEDRETFGEFPPESAEEYWYAVFVVDGCGNWSEGAQVGPVSPNDPILVVGDGAEPPNQSVCPGGAETEVNAFTLRTSRDTDAVTSVTVTLSSGSAEVLAKVELLDQDGARLGAVDWPTADEVVIVPGNPIAVDTRLTEYRVRITPVSHAMLSSFEDRSYPIRARVTAVESTLEKAYADESSATITLDNQAPASPVWTTYRVEGSGVVLGWDNPQDADFAEVMLASAPQPLTAVPDEGQVCHEDAIVGSASVRLCSATPGFQDVAAGALEAYYGLFARDVCGNYSKGVMVGPEGLGTDGGPSHVMGVYDVGGCGCSAGGGPAGGLFLLTLIGGALARRRRSIAGQA